MPEILHDGLSRVWYKVDYHGIIGYSYSGFFDLYQNILPEDIVDLQGIQTEDLYDAKQYIVWEGRKKLNMCGEICVAYILGLSLEETLEGWTRKSPNLVARIFKGSVDRGTGAQTLIDLIESFDVEGSETISSFFKDELLGRAVFTAQRASEALEDHEIILGVRIGNDGYVGTGKINHWVVLDSMDVYGKQAVCTVFNPYMNRYEVYSWSELMRYNAGIDGVVIPTEDEDDDWVKSITSGYVEVEGSVDKTITSVVTSTHDGDDYINYDEIDKIRVELEEEFEPTLKEKLYILWNKHLREIDP